MGELVYNVWIFKAICFSNDVFGCNVSNVDPLNAIPLNTAPLNAIPLKCVSLNNQECKIRSEIININSNKLLFYPYNIKVNKCSGSCKNINDPYLKLCVPDVVKNMNIRVFNLREHTLSI